MRAMERFDAYLFGELTAEERNAFEAELRQDAQLAEAFEKHRQLVEAMNQAERQQQMKTLLKKIHTEEIGKEAEIISIRKESFFRKHGPTVAVAASVGVIAVLATVAMLSAGGYLLKKQGNDITLLQRDVAGLKYSQDAILETITNAGEKRKANAPAPANMEGTGFAINNKGYFVTSWHLIEAADSVFIENKAISRSQAHVVAFDKNLDIAVLKLNSDTLMKGMNLPFAIAVQEKEMGEKVFTLGYPRKDIVYGEGSLSAGSGYMNDTSMYQVSIPVNRGNSGGPLLDEQGNVIGVVHGKLEAAEGTGFAVKSIYIKQVLENVPDSTKKELNTTFRRGGSLKGMKRNEQIKRIQPFVYNVLVYKRNP